MKTNWKAPILAGFGLVSLAVAIPMGVANAQQNDQAAGGQQRGQGAPPVQGQFRGDLPPDMQRGDMMQRMGGMGGGPAAMVTDNAFLYILQGNQLYKVNKNNLEVVGQGMLPMPGPMGGPGAPGVRSGGPGAGGPPRTSGGGGGEEAK